jgi:hypothetical protein
MCGPRIFRACIHGEAQTIQAPDESIFLFMQGAEIKNLTEAEVLRCALLVSEEARPASNSSPSTVPSAAALPAGAAAGEPVAAASAPSAAEFGDTVKLHALATKRLEAVGFEQFFGGGPERVHPEQLH